MTVSSEQIEDRIIDFELFSQFWSVIMTYSYQNNFNIDVENKFWNRYSVPLRRELFLNISDYSEH